MKYLKIMLCALILAFTFASAQAQVVVRAHIGGPVYHHPHYRHWHHRHEWHHRHWHHRYHRY